MEEDKMYSRLPTVTFHLDNGDDESTDGKNNGCFGDEETDTETERFVYIVFHWSVNVNVLSGCDILVIHCSYCHCQDVKFHICTEHNQDIHEIYRAR